MSTQETKLAHDALDRDLDRYSNSVDDRDRLRIMDRMIDTLCDLDPELDLADARTKVIELIRSQAPRPITGWGGQA